MNAENIQAFERSIDRLDSSLHELRHVAFNMIPEVLVKDGLDTALRDLCIGLNMSGTLQVNYQSNGLEDAQPDIPIAIELFHIARELMNNFIRHAAAQRANMQLSKINGYLTLRVENDGRSLEPLSPGFTEGTGWQFIRNRVDLLEGKIDLQSMPGKGSSVMIVVKI